MSEVGSHRLGDQNLMHIASHLSRLTSLVGALATEIS